MTPGARAAAVIALAAGCSSSADPSAAPPAPVTADAGITRADPSVAVVADDVPPPIVTRETRRPGRPIEIMLRSSPPHSLVAVDGVQLGITPQVWEGTTGAEHEFTFVMTAYAVARYRFVPITSGVVHARLEPIIDATPALGSAPPPELARPRPAPPPTVVPPALPTVDPPATTPVPMPPPTGPGPQP